MSETLGGDFVYQVLSTDSDVTAITNAIYNAGMVPETEDSLTTINAYHVGVFDKRLDYFQTEWSVDCRAAGGHDSMELALKAADALNRRFKTIGAKQYFGTVQVGQTVPPQDETDVYNTPLSVTIRRK